MNKKEYMQIFNYNGKKYKKQRKVERRIRKKK